MSETLFGLMRVVAEPFNIWYFGEWWQIRQYNTGYDQIRYNELAGIEFTFVNEHGHDKIFKFSYDPLVEPYRKDGIRKGYRIMSPNEKSKRFWIIMLREICVKNTAVQYSTTEYDDEGSALFEARNAAKNNPCYQYFVMESVSVSHTQTVVTESLRP